MATPTTTRLDIRQKVVKKLDSPRYPIVSAATSLAGGTTVLEDTGLAPGSQTEDFIGAWIYIADDVGAGPSVGEIARVTNVNFTGTNSQLIVAPAFSAAVINAQAYEIHRQFHPTHVADKIDEILENLRRDIYIPLGALSANSDADWTDVGTATDADDPSNAFYGDGSVSTVSDTSMATSYIKTFNLGVVGGEVVMVYGWVGQLLNTAVARLSLWDTTNDAEIDFALFQGSDRGTGDEAQWRLAHFLADVPATCDQVHLRFSSFLAGNDDSANINFASIVPVNRRVFDLKSEFEWPEDVDTTLYYTKLGVEDSTNANNQNVFHLKEEQLMKWCDLDVRQIGDVRNATLHLDRNSDLRFPMLVRGRVDYDKLADDITSSVVPEDLIVDLVYIELVEELAQEDLEDENIPGFEAKMGKAQAVRNKLDPLARDKSPARSKVHGTITGHRRRNYRGGNWSR